MKKGEILFREGEKLEKAWIVLKGRVALTSTLGYEIEVGEGEVLGEWKLIGEAQESATAVTDVELAEIEEIGFYWGLLNRAFSRLERVNDSFSGELRPPSEVMRIVFNLKKGRWKRVEDVLKGPYFRARQMIAEGDYESALRELMKIDRRTADPDIAGDAEVLKTLCMFFTSPENATRRYNTLMRKKEEFGKYVSFRALVDVVNKGIDEIDTMLKMYLKHGMVIPSNTIVILEGDTGEDTYFVLSGYPRVARYSSGEEKLLAFLGPGEFFGEMSPLGTSVRSATIFTSSMVQLLRFEGETLRKIVEENEKFGLELLKATLKRIKRMRKFKEAGSDPVKKLRILMEDRSVKELNDMRITIDEMVSYLGMRKGDVVSFMMERRIASMKPDGTLRFNEGARV